MTVRCVLRFGILAVLVGACSHSEGERVKDQHSFSEPDRARVVHADIDWELDFQARRLGGSVTWSVERDDPRAPLVLDTRGLVVDGVRTGGGGALDEAAYEHADADEVFGRSLVIPLPEGHDRVEVRYHTTDQSSGLQWLSAEQTADGGYPFMFSQAQAIHARTMIPCQDSPGVRFTFSARVFAPEGIRPVMAAEIEPNRNPDGSWHFRMPQPIPSYLLAIAAGDIAFRATGSRAGVWAEPSVLDKAAWEFADTERMMEEAEALYGPYRWGRYDILVLPPSFPFGGMENPRLTFATPTVLAGDRSLTALIAHELAHSWSGNLVTNATWSDFWLNEGFTVYFERRIMEAVYGGARAEMEAMIGRGDLAEDLEELPPGDTILHVDLEGRDPDDAFSNVPYEKGYLFLRLLEGAVGREPFDAFLKQWFERYAFRSRTTEDFVRYLNGNLLTSEQASALRVDEWLYSPGLPDNAPTAESSAFTQCAEKARAIAAGSLKAADLGAEDWITHQWIHFTRALPDGIAVDTLGELDAAWKLTGTGNSEILSQWLLVSIREGYSRANEALDRFLTSQGRRKFLKPLYAELAKTDEGRRRALEIYRRARPRYHAIAQGTIDELLDYTP